MVLARKLHCVLQGKTLYSHSVSLQPGLKNYCTSKLNAWGTPCNGLASQQGGGGVEIPLDALGYWANGLLGSNADLQETGDPRQSVRAGIDASVKWLCKSSSAVLVTSMDVFCITAYAFPSTFNRAFWSPARVNSNKKHGQGGGGVTALIIAVWTESWLNKSPPKNLE